MSRALVWVLLAAGLARAQGRETHVETAAVERREIVPGRSFVGTVEGARASTVGSELDGLVTELLVEEGDRVEKGQVLAKLRTKVIEERLAAARAQLELRRQELAELENGSRPEEIAKARARVAQAQAELDYRDWKVESALRLFRANTISEDEVKDAEFAARSAKEKLKEEQASLALVEAGPRKEKIAQARARVQAQQAEVARTEDDLARHTIRAPFTGYVVEEHAEVGAWLSKGSPVAEVVALDEVDVTVPVLEDYISSLKLGADVPVAIDALQRTLTGTLVAIVPKADERARTFPVRIRVANVREGGTVLLKAGMFARISLQVGEKIQAVVVPKDALVLGMGPSPMVFVVDPQSSTVSPVRVQAGAGVDDMIQVIGPLQPGQIVVIRGNERLRPGQKVRLPK